MFPVPQATNDRDEAATSNVHGSLMVALEHSSGVVRARAIDQLSRAISTDVAANAVADSASASEAVEGEDLSPALLRRLHDEVPEVVLAITNSDALVQQVLLRPACSSVNTGGQAHTEVIKVSVALSSVNRAAEVACTAANAAVPWLSAISEARPKHPIASSGKVLSGLVRLGAAAAAAAATACASGDNDNIGQEGSIAARKARDSALALCLECLPGPHTNARVKLAQQSASASVGASGGGVPAEGDAASAGAAAATGKACKKAMRSVGRAAMEAVSGLSSVAEGADLVGLFSGVMEVLEQDDGGKGKGSSKSPSKKSKKSKSAGVDAMDVEGSSKSKGLKAMGEEVCDVLASSVVRACGEKKSKIEELQVRVRR